jgi:hypothetical protein
MAQGNRYRPYDAPYESDYPSYDDRYAEPVDLDSLGSQVRSTHSSRSVATREEFLPEDSVPLFLSGADEELRSSKFARPKKTGSRLLKTGAFAVAALVATFVAVKNPFTVFANATASLMGTSEVRQAAAPPPAAPPRQAAATAVASTPAMVAGPALATAAAPLPSRDEIAAALKTAHQSVAPAEPQQPTTTVAAAAPTATVPVAAVPAAPAPAVAVAPPIRRISADELANLMSRGKSLLQSGDIAPARLLLERAAEAGEASAALMVAETYDPAVLGTQDTRNITADPAQARHWYQRAAQLGSTDAQRRLSQLQ